MSFNTFNHPNQPSQFQQINQSHSQQQQQQQSGHNSSTGLPPLLQSARLHELVVAGTGQNERLEPALEHVIIKSESSLFFNN